MKVRERVLEFHAVTEREAKSSSASATAIAEERSSQELEELWYCYQRLYRGRSAVGQMPPSPETYRAKIGGLLIRIVQRMLFWYTPRIVEFHNETTTALNHAHALLEIQRQQISDLLEQIRELRKDVHGVKLASVNGNHGMAKEKILLPIDARAKSSGIVDSFLFSMQDRFRGPEIETRGKLQTYLDVIRTMNVPEGPWLDIGCGRGEWLSLSQQEGRAALGIDSSARAVEYCGQQGLDAKREDAVEYLTGVPDESLAVITAFHVAEHLPAEYLLSLVQQAARALKRGGLIILETPDPANLSMGCHLFWRDLTHTRPIPVALMELVLEYFGVTIVQRLHLNPAPEASWLPFVELEFVRRLNDQLYGPQDYGLIGRR